MSREVFTTCNPLAVSCVLYQEEAMTNLWGAGKYYDGVTCWVVNSSGEITGTASCDAPTYRLFEADEYVCDGVTCDFVQSNVVVALDDTYSPNYGNFYELQAGGFYYELITEVYTGPGAILNPTPNYANCNTWCSV